MAIRITAATPASVIVAVFFRIMATGTIAVDQEHSALLPGAEFKKVRRPLMSIANTIGRIGTGGEPPGNRHTHRYARERRKMP